MDSWDHPAAAKIVVIGVPHADAAEVEAARVLWAVNLEIYMPAMPSIVFNHLLMVSLLTGMCGFWKLISDFHYQNFVFVGKSSISL